MAVWLTESRVGDDWIEKGVLHKKPPESGVKGVTPMSKRIYRAVPVQQIRSEALIEAFKGEKRIVFGCDAAKSTWRGAFMTATSKLIAIVSWDLLETALVVHLLSALRSAGLNIEVVAAPTGTYADPFAAQVQKAGFQMYAVSSKHTHDYAEIYDGVPSQHDSKDAAIVAKVHLERRRATPWPKSSEQQRDLRALCTRVDWLKQEQQADEARAEGLLSRHWPELLRELELGSASLGWLLEEFGSPAAVAAEREHAREGLLKVSRRLLNAEKIERIVGSAERTLGQPTTRAERELLQTLGRRMRERQRALREAENAVKKGSLEHPVVQALATCLGPITAAIIVAYVGDPREFPNARALLKHVGLNLKERSSGKHKGHVGITKRGSSVVRRWIYLAALRLIKSDPVVRAWVDRKAVRIGDKPMKMKAIVALMRKLLTALRYIADGQRFDSTKLFDVARLKRLRALPAHFDVATAAAI
jgi:transposase